MNRIFTYISVLVSLIACSPAQNDVAYTSDNQPQNGTDPHSGSSDQQGQSGQQGQVDNGFKLNRADIIGSWQIVEAKFSEEATMTAWEFEETYAEFKDNGLYEGKGYFGNSQGTFTVEGNIITAKIDNEPFIVYEVTALQESRVWLTTTLASNRQKIWLICERAEFLDVQPVDYLSEDVFFQNEANVSMYVAGIYSGMVDFVKLKQKVLSQVESGVFRDITPSSADIRDLWGRAYKLLRLINVAYQHLSENDAAAFNTEDYCSHLRVLRGFIGYNLAMLWGNVPYYQNVPELTDKIPVRDAMYILDAAIKDLSVMPGYHFSSYPDYYFFNTTVSVIIRAECYLTLGNKATALELLQNNTSLDRNADLYLLLFDQGEEIPIYKRGFYDLLTDEARGQLKADDLELKWRQEGLSYDHWFFLKRIGKAQEVSGCEAFQLLLPIPQSELERNPDLIQNSGY